MEVYIAEDVSEYRKLAKKLLKKNDVVLEVGCGFGKTSYLLSKISRMVVGIDVSKDAVQQAKRYEKLSSNLKILCVDAFDVGKLLRIEKNFTAILIDIGGSAKPWEVLRLFSKLTAVYSPRVVIIKNYPLKRFVERVKNLS